MKWMLCAALTASMGLGLTGCEDPNAPDPDMVRIAMAMAPCEYAVNAIVEDSRDDPAARPRLTQAAAGACAPVSAAVRALPEPEGDVAAFTAAREACAAEMDARMAALVSRMNLDAMEVAGTATVEGDLGGQQDNAAALEARDRCTAALGSPAYQLRRDAGLETAAS